ncbi:hypothetical protein AAVH_28562 [Aphelenchoides avenae]|nr:hypothetical protein AAVH_28562 [Aphelenchus avenae]
MVNERLVHENYALRQLAEQQQERLALLNSADGTGGAPSTSADVANPNVGQVESVPRVVVVGPNAVRDEATRQQELLQEQQRQADEAELHAAVAAILGEEAQELGREVTPAPPARTLEAAPFGEEQQELARVVSPAPPARTPDRAERSIWEDNSDDSEGEPLAVEG